LIGTVHRNLETLNTNNHVTSCRLLIAFGIVAPNTRYAASLTDAQAKELIKKNNLEDEYIIYGQEGDDF
jgi:hypothetical protein